MYTGLLSAIWALQILVQNQIILFRSKDKINWKYDLKFHYNHKNLYNLGVLPHSSPIFWWTIHKNPVFISLLSASAAICDVFCEIYSNMTWKSSFLVLFEKWLKCLKNIFWLYFLKIWYINFQKCLTSPISDICGKRSMCLNN